MAFDQRGQTVGKQVNIGDEFRRSPADSARWTLICGICGDQWKSNPEETTAQSVAAVSAWMTNHFD